MNKLYSLAIRHKELIKKILPIHFLRTCKAKVIQAKIRQYHAEPILVSAFQAMQAGINLIGDIRIEIGLGQSMRLIANALALSKYDFCIVDLPLNVDVRRNDHNWDHKITQNPVHSINLLHINPQELGLSYLTLGKEVFRNRYNIGFWLWELEDIPEESRQALKFVDEIWTPSEFTSSSFRKITDKPVCTIPYYVTAEADPRYDRSYFGFPEEKFLYLIVFDFNSTMLRKNPAGAVAAFKKAFGPDNTDVGLVIKVNNPTEECLNSLHMLLEGYENIYYITKTLDKAEVNSLIGCVDVFVSLHRAEGFGLVMAEAMMLKTACIATDWSSNTEFMNPDTACMVSCTMKQIAEGEGNYPPGAIWADPDIDEAAMYMRKLKESPAFYQGLVERAYSYTSDVLGKEKVVNLIQQRIDQIYAEILNK